MKTGAIGEVHKILTKNNIRTKYDDDEISEYILMALESISSRFSCFLKRDKKRIVPDFIPIIFSTAAQYAIIAQKINVAVSDKSKRSLSRAKNLDKIIKKFRKKTEGYFKLFEASFVFKG